MISNYACVTQVLYELKNNNRYNSIKSVVSVNTQQCLMSIVQCCREIDKVNYYDIYND